MTSRVRIRQLALAVVLVVASNRMAGAQATETRGYGEAYAQSAFGNVTSQSYGFEAGVQVWEKLQVFVDVGQVRNVASDALSANAQVIAATLTSLQGANASYTVKQPVVFFGAGVRYPFALEQSKIHPYVLFGGGAARVKNDVTFTLGGTGSIDQFVTLGSDLSGSETKPMFTFGGGAQWPAYQRLVVDFQFRYGRIFTDGEGTNVSRAGIGLGFTF